MSIVGHAIAAHRSGVCHNLKPCRKKGLQTTPRISKKGSRVRDWQAMCLDYRLRRNVAVQLAICPTAPICPPSASHTSQSHRSHATRPFPGPHFGLRRRFWSRRSSPCVRCNRNSSQSRWFRVARRRRPVRVRRLQLWKLRRLFRRERGRLPTLRAQRPLIDRDRSVPLPPDNTRQQPTRSQIVPVNHASINLQMPHLARLRVSHESAVEHGTGAWNFCDHRRDEARCGAFGGRECPFMGSQEVHARFGGQGHLEDGSDVAVSRSRMSLSNQQTYCLCSIRNNPCMVNRTVNSRINEKIPC